MAQLFATALDGTRLFVRTRPATSLAASTTSSGGSAPKRITAVLCDGIACDGFIWKYLWDDLARVVDVAHWNYRGHGRSGKPVDPAAITLADHARDLGVVRRAIGDGPVVLFGHSMGCQVVLESLREQADQVLGLVLVCGSYGRVTHTFKGTNVLATWLPRLIARVDANPEIARAMWGHVPPEVALQVALLTGEVDRDAIRPEDLLQYMRHMVDIDLPMFLRMLQSAGDHTTLDLLPSIQIPALVIAGDRDTFTPARYAEEMAAAMPNAELLMVQGATHVAPIERKELVADRVEKFLRERVCAPPPSAS
jgi:pimeloyl-ACP methyl ester carboxylesterase